MPEQTIMTITSLKKLLTKIETKLNNDYQIWLSSDEEGNQFLPMFENPELSLAIDKKAKKIIFFPSHC